VVRRAEEDRVAELAEPAVPRHRAVVHGAAHQQAAHAVADERELLQRLRPLLGQALELLRQRVAVDRDMQAAVVVQVDAREAEFARQRRAMVVAVT
jgi:hypothetical protein